MAGTCPTDTNEHAIRRHNYLIANITATNKIKNRLMQFIGHY